MITSYTSTGGAYQFFDGRGNLKGYFQVANSWVSYPSNSLDNTRGVTIHEGAPPVGGKKLHLPIATLNALGFTTADSFIAQFAADRNDALTGGGGSSSSGIPSYPTDPITPVNGDVWFNSTEGVLKFKTASGVTELEKIEDTSAPFDVIADVPYVYNTGLTHISDYGIYDGVKEETDSFESDVNGGQIIIYSNQTVTGLTIKASGS